MFLKVVLTAFAALIFCSSCGAAGSASVHRVLFLGNSITAHGPSPAIGWYGNWGMAASDANRDYVHQLVARLGGVEHAEVNMYAFERAFTSFDLNSLDSSLSPRPDLVVLQIGDNVTDAAGFVQHYDALVKHLIARGTPLVLCTSTWWMSSVSAGVKGICSKPNMRFVDISRLREEASNIAGSERTFSSAAVADHPGDKGMAAIADALYSAIR